MLRLSEWLRSKTQVTAHAEEDVEQEEDSTVAGECKLVQSLWKLVWQFFRKLEFSLPQDPQDATLGHILKRCCTILPQGHLLNYVHSSFICNNQNLEAA